MSKILITGYDNPDLDAYSCTYAYSELLNRKGKDVVGVFDGNIHREVEFVLNKFNIKKIENLDNIKDFDEVILVDTDSSLNIDDDKIIEVVDHRKIHEADRLKNLKKKQIELVGACATLIAEKFYKEKIDPSMESAILLYSAIASNTVNFQGGVTTTRDRAMFQWLEGFIEIEDDYIEEMFKAKSDLGGRNLKEIIIEDSKKMQIGNYNTLIPQLEIINVKDFVSKDINSIEKYLKEIKEEEKYDYIFFTIIDVMKGFNKIIAIDKKSQRLIVETLGLNFENNIATTNSVLMRKEIIPKVKEYLEGSEN